MANRPIDGFITTYNPATGTFTGHANRRLATNLFGPGKHGHTDGNPVGPVLPSITSAADFNVITEEICNFVEIVGNGEITLDQDDYAQMAKALERHELRSAIQNWHIVESPPLDIIKSFIAAGQGPDIKNRVIIAIGDVASTTVVTYKHGASGIKASTSTAPNSITLYSERILATPEGRVIVANGDNGCIISRDFGENWEFLDDHNFWFLGLPIGMWMGKIISDDTILYYDYDMRDVIGSHSSYVLHPIGNECRLLHAMSHNGVAVAVTEEAPFFNGRLAIAATSSPGADFSWGGGQILVGSEASGATVLIDSVDSIYITDSNGVGWFVVAAHDNATGNPIVARSQNPLLGGWTYASQPDVKSHNFGSISLSSIGDIMFLKTQDTKNVAPFHRIYNTTDISGLSSWDTIPSVPLHNIFHMSSFGNSLYGGGLNQDERFKIFKTSEV